MNYKNFKTVVIARNLPVFYEETEDLYRLLSYEGPVVLKGIVYRKVEDFGGIDREVEAANLVDFEQNVKGEAFNIS